MKIPLKSKAIFPIILFLFLLISIHKLYLLNSEKKINPEDISVAEKLIELQFNPKDRELMIDDINENLVNYEKIRSVKLENSVPPSLYFNPIPLGYRVEREKNNLKYQS